MNRPIWLIIIGFILEVTAIALIVLILLGVLRSTFFLNFFAFTISVIGLLMGFIGSTVIVKSKRDAQKPRD